MKYSELISTARPFQQCIEDIKRNKDTSFNWFAAIGKDGCLLEMGGRNKTELEIKVSIPHYDENGIPVIYPLNGYVHFDYSFDKFGLQLPTVNVSHDIDVMKLLKTKDFRVWKPEVKLYERVAQTVTDGKITNLK